MVLKVTARNYQREVVRSEVPVLVEFFATWCRKCAMMEDIVNEISEEYAECIKVCRININESAALSAEFEVKVVPTFVVFRQGEPVAAASGVLCKERLLELL